MCYAVGKHTVWTRSFENIAVFHLENQEKLVTVKIAYLEMENS